MENSAQRKWVNICFLVASLLLGYVVFSVLFKLAGVYDFEAKIKNIDLVIRLVSIGLGAVLFLGLWKSDSANQFMLEVVTELSRMTWPTQKETLSATWITLIMVLISGMFLGLLDKFWTLVIQWIL